MSATTRNVLKAYQGQLRCLPPLTSMSLTSHPSQNAAKPVPLTPIRRLLCKMNFGRPMLGPLGKRSRESLNMTISSTASSAVTSTLSSPGGKLDFVPSPPDPQPKPERVRIAIQKDDDPFDAIVITTLPFYPFCCHEDLIMMSRQQLIEVALALNNHLPNAVQIKVSDALTDVHIRHSIETLLGIIPNTPPAPKPVRSWPIKNQTDLRQAMSELELESESGSPLGIHPSSPTSPLAMRISRRRGFSSVRTPPRRLERLDEADERCMISAERPLKKRKVSHDKYTPTRFRYDNSGMTMDTSPIYNLALNSSRAHALLSPMDEDASYARPDTCLSVLKTSI